MVSAGSDYVPTLFQPARKIADLYVYTNLKINLEDIQRTIMLAQDTQLYAALIDELTDHGFHVDHMELVEAANRYVEHKIQEQRAINTAHSRSFS